LNITSHIPPKALKDYANTLNLISKKAYPTAIRDTLNNAAFDVKKNTMPKSSGQFVKRVSTFFKASSTVEMAKGNNVLTMQSVIGFKPKNDKKAHSIEDLEQQEHGGKIKDRDYIAGRGARTGESWNKMVRTGLKLKDLKSRIKESNLIDAHRVSTKNYSATQKRNYEKSGLKGQLSKKQKFIRSAFMAQKTGRFVLGNKTSTGSRTISRIDSAVKIGGKIRIKRTALYSYNKGRLAPVKATHFMKRASMETSLSINKWFIVNAEKQINRIFK
jgi:hypothetical protein